jgi:hypothetical protein
MAKGDRPRGNKPLDIARARQTPESEVMVTIGAAWPFNEGDGLVVKLQMIPTQWSGDFILVTPKEE